MALLDHLDAYTVVGAPSAADFRAGEDLELVVGDTVVCVGPAPRWCMGVVLGCELREAKPFPTGPSSYVHQIGPEDICELTAAQVDWLSADVAELTVQPEEEDDDGDEPDRRELTYSLSGAQLLQLTQTLPSSLRQSMRQSMTAPVVRDDSDEDGSDHEELMHTASYKTPFEDTSPPSTPSSGGQSEMSVGHADSSSPPVMDDLLSAEKATDIIDLDAIDNKLAKTVSRPVSMVDDARPPVYTEGDLVEVFDDGEWVKAEVFAVEDNTVTCTIPPHDGSAGSPREVAYRVINPSDAAALRPMQAATVVESESESESDEEQDLPVVPPLVVHVQIGGTGAFQKLQLEASYPHATFLPPGGTLSLRRADMAGASIRVPNSERPGYEVAIRVNLATADNQGDKKYIISPVNPAELARLKAALSPARNPVLETTPEARCRKQRPAQGVAVPTVATAWPYRYAKIDGKSLLFFDNQGDTEYRGSSIVDLTGCTVKVSLENFAVEASSEDRGNFYKIKLTRKGHSNGLPDLRGAGGVSRFCFKEEADCDRFAAALTNLAAGRAWNQMHAPVAPQPPLPRPVSRTGAMEKQGEGLDSAFKPRFFKLNGWKLEYFERSDSRSAKGCLDMSTAVCVQRPGIWSWQSSRERNEWKQYDQAMCNKLETAHREATAGDDVDLMHNSVSVDDQRYVDMRQMCQARRDGPDSTRAVRREDGTEIVVKALQEGTQKSGQFERKWRIWRFRCTGSNAAVEAAAWEESLRASMDAKECTAIIGGATVELATPGTERQEPQRCEVRPGETGFGASRMHLGVIEGQDGAARYQLSDLCGVVSVTELLWGGKYIITAQIDARSTLTLRFDKGCEAHRDRVLVAIARATDTSAPPERPSLSEHVRRVSTRMSATMSDSADEVRRSAGKVAGVLKMAGSGGGAAMPIPRTSGGR